MLTGIFIGVVGTVLVFTVARACYRAISRRRRRVVTRGRMIDLFA